MHTSETTERVNILPENIVAMRRKRSIFGGQHQKWSLTAITITRKGPERR